MADKGRLCFLHTNDLHGHLSHAKVDKLAHYRESADLYFDSGDCIKAGNLAIPLKPDPVWPLLSELNLTASTLGNRESHLQHGLIQRKIEGAQHPILVANIRDREGNRPFPASLELEVKGLRIGILGVMVAMISPRMKTAIASRYLWEPPILSAEAVAEELRPRCDLLIALTHIGLSEDRKLATRGTGIDLILGGHSHDTLAAPEQHGETTILQAGAFAKWFGMGIFAPGEGLVQYRLIPWA